VFDLLPEVVGDGKIVKTTVLVAGSEESIGFVQVVVNFIVQLQVGHLLNYCGLNIDDVDLEDQFAAGRN
jgi:hypothetical protein